MFSRFIAIVLLGCTVAQAQLKVGSVRIDELFNKHPDKAAYQVVTKAKQEAIANDPRKTTQDEKAAALLAIEQQGRDLLNSLNNMRPGTDKDEATAKAREIVEQRNKLMAEYEAARQDFQDFRTKEMKALNQDMARKMREILNKIVALIEAEAKKRDLDLVFEVSGYSNTGVQVMPYFKKAIVIDLTADLVKIIEASAPAGAKPNP